MDLTLEHIDPQQHPLVCGLRCDLNEVIADGSYNFSKGAQFVPYRVCDYPAPENPGDLGEFLIRGSWLVTEFYGWWWQQEAVSLLVTVGKRGGNHRADWEKRCQEKELAHPSRIIVSSYDGRLSKDSLAVRVCPHQVSKPAPLWFFCKPSKYCCRTHQNREQNYRKQRHLSQCRR